MIAAVAERYGSAEVVAVRERPLPVPGKGQVRVRVRASSLNPIDAKLRSGSLRPFLWLRFPAVLGYDLAGEIESLGPGVRGFAVGDRVYGRTDRLTGGAHAEFAVVGGRVLDRIPGSLSYEQAAALPLVGMTALQALRDVARLAHGQSVLINGAAGGVGAHALQIARALGARVTAVVGSGAVDLARRLGAEQVVDYTRGELERLERRHDVVFDTVFSRPFRDFERLLAPRGVYVTTGFSPGLALRSASSRLGGGRRIAFVVSTADGERMWSLSAMASERQLEPVIEGSWPLERIREAYERLEAGHLRGKIVIRIP